MVEIAGSNPAGTTDDCSCGPSGEGASPTRRNYPRIEGGCGDWGTQHHLAPLDSFRHGRLFIAAFANVVRADLFFSFREAIVPEPDSLAIGAKFPEGLAFAVNVDQEIVTQGQWLGAAAHMESEAGPSSAWTAFVPMGWVVVSRV